MNYLQGLHKQLLNGVIQYAGTMSIMHEADSVKRFYSPNSPWGVMMMNESQQLYGVPPFRYALDFIEWSKKWGKANTNAIYWLCIEPLDTITDLKLIIKIGQTAATGGMYRRFSNYSAGIFYKGGERTNLSVYKAMVAMGVSKVHIYYEIQPSLVATLEPWGTKEKTTGNMLIREKSHVAMYTDDMGKKPIGNKQ